MPTTKQFTIRLSPNVISALEMERQKRELNTIQQVVYEILNERYSGGKPVFDKELIKVCEVLNEYLSCLRIFDPNNVTLKQATSASIDGTVVKINTEETKKVRLPDQWIA